MNLNFEEFKRANLGLKELENIRIKSFERFKERGFPTKREENWKYTDLKSIINNNFTELQIFKNKKSLQFNNKHLIKNFKHNRIILLNGNFIESNFSFENENKISIKSLKVALENKEDFKKLKNYFKDEKNSMVSLNHALVNDGIIFEIDDITDIKKNSLI